MEVRGRAALPHSCHAAAAAAAAAQTLPKSGKTSHCLIKGAKVGKGCAEATAAAAAAAARRAHRSSCNDVADVSMLQAVGHGPKRVSGYMGSLHSKALGAEAYLEGCQVSALNVRSHTTTK
jgi:hypothetical protein